MEEKQLQKQMEDQKEISCSFLSCSLCCERFSDPCSLRCGHTFCKRCLAKFTITCEVAIKAKSIQCPSCSQLTEIRRPEDPVEDWPKQLKPHALIQGFLNKFANCGDNNQVSEEEPNASRLCFSCQQVAKVVGAGYMCQDCNITLCGDCVKRHRALPATKHHAIIDLQGEVKVPGRVKVICKEHKEAIEYCCHDCNVAVCQKCSVVYHRKCDSVVTMESMVENMKTVVSDSFRSVQEVVEDLQTNLILKQSEITEVDHNKVEVQSEIWQVTQLATDIIKHKEKELLDDLEELAKKQTGQLEKEIQTVEIDLQMYKHLSEYMDQALVCENEIELYDIYRMCQTGAVKSAVNTPWQSRAKGITFENKLDLKTFELSFELGALKLPYDQSVLSKKLILHDSIDIRTDGDKRDPQAFDVAVLDCNGVEAVVVIDNSNDCIKSFYSRGGHTICSIIRLDHKPCTVSRLKNKQAVVSFDSHRAFLIVNVTPDLSIESYNETQKQYKCLTVMGETQLAGGCKDPSSIDILDLSGVVLRSVTTSVVNAPWFMCACYEGRLVVSDCSINKGLLCMTTDGEILFRWSPEGINGTSGITQSSTGEILIADCLNRKVIQLSRDGEFGKDILTTQDGLHSGLYGICLLGNKLFVANWKEGVKVYLFE